MTSSRIESSESIIGDILTDTRPSMPASCLVLLAQLLPCVLLMLFGWGFDDLRAFVTSAARSGFAIVLLAAGIAVLKLRLDVHPLRKGSEPLGHQNVELAALLLASLFLLWFLPFADRRHIFVFGQSYWRYLGLLFCVAGAGVRLLALRDLGAHFSAYVTLQPGHQLVRRGVYGKVRHPLYLSLLLIPTGIALVFDSLLFVPIVGLALVFVSDRIKKEEHLLASRFGSTFADYRRSTWSVLPLIY